MDSALRDLDQIRESETASSGRKLGLVVLATLAVVGLVFALGMLAGGGEQTGDADVDPLARLDRAAGLAPSAPAKAAPVDVERESLTFQQTLEDEDSRPEVEAALAAARAEAQHPDPIDGVAVAPLAPSPAPGDVAALAASPLPPDFAHGGGARPSAILAAATLPASIAGGAARVALPRQPFPTTPGRPVAPAGREGAYTLQVISYDESDEARAFAAALRARGHQAFVVDADVEGRGHFWRVRIGPFNNMAEADEYRRRFEADERMNTIVVRRDASETSIARE